MYLTYNQRWAFIQHCDQTIFSKRNTRFKFMCSICNIHQAQPHSTCHFRHSFTSSIMCVSCYKSQTTLRCISIGGDGNTTIRPTAADSTMSPLIAGVLQDMERSRRPESGWMSGWMSHKNRKFTITSDDSLSPHRITLYEQSSAARFKTIHRKRRLRSSQ